MKKNKQSKTKFLSLILILLVLFGSSCKKENGIRNQLATEEVSIKNGHLTFSKNAFTNLMHESHQKKSTDVITKLISNLDGHQDFISLKQEAINIHNTGKLSGISLKNALRMTLVGPQPQLPPGGDPGTPADPPLEPILELAELVPDPYFASVLNPEGEVEVDNTLYKVTEYGTFLIANEDKAELEGLVTNLDNGLDLSGDLVSEGEDFFSLRNHKKIFFIDTYHKMHDFGNTSSTTPPTNTIIDFPLGENVFTNVDVYEFNDAKTWAGKGLQALFGRDHFKSYNNTDKARLKINFYSTNWGAFASVGVRSVIQTRGWTGLYRPFENFDEMRLGWSNMIIKLDVPQIEDPTAKSPVDFWNTVSNAITSNVNFRFNDQGKDYLVYRISDIIAINNIGNFLPQDIRNHLNTLIQKTQNIPLNAGALIESQFDKQIIERLVKIIQAKAVDKTKGVAFSTRPRGTGIDHILIPTEWEYRYNNNGDAVQSKTFDFQTMIIGLKGDESGNIKPTIKLAKTIEVISGEVIALGKLNSEWVGMSVVKK